jgi:hypothetical protein
LYGGGFGKEVLERRFGRRFGRSLEELKELGGAWGA